LGRQIQSKGRRLAVAGIRKAVSEVRKEAEKASISERQRECCPRGGRGTGLTRLGAFAGAGWIYR